MEILLKNWGTLRKPSTQDFLKSIFRRQYHESVVFWSLSYYIIEVSMSVKNLQSKKTTEVNEIYPEMVKALDKEVVVM